MTLPPGYVWVEVSRVRAFALAGPADWARSVLASGETLHGWACRRDGAAELGGRAGAVSVPAGASGPDGHARWAVRHYRRGGAVAAVLGDRYARLGTSRPLREAGASAAARARGVPTPAVIAGAVYPRGLVYRADIVTELLPDGRDLADVLFGPDAAEPAVAAASLRAAARLVRTLEEARLVHADLNAMNVLLSGEGARPAAHALDLDRCRVLPLTARRPRDVMRRRLVRSLRKLGETRGPAIDVDGWAALAEGFRDPV